jgi:hypothetical protein
MKKEHYEKGRTHFADGEIAQHYYANSSSIY